MIHTQEQLEALADTDLGAVVSKVLFDGKDQIGVGMPPDYPTSWVAMGEVWKKIKILGFAMSVEHDDTEGVCVDIWRAYTSDDDSIRCEAKEVEDIPRTVAIAAVLAVQEMKP